MSHARRWGLLTASLIGLTLGAAADTFDARVIGVSDGDTITVLRDRTPVKLRLHGVDAPETGQDFGTQAKALTSKLAFGQTVSVKVVDTDRYGRLVAEVSLADGRLLNHELVRAGLAWWYRKYAPHDHDLERLESDARTGRRGLWADPEPTAPWDYRQGPPLPPELVGKFVGNRSSHLYHQPGCRAISKLRAAHRVAFDSASDAEAAGYTAGKDCLRTR